MASRKITSLNPLNFRVSCHREIRRKTAKKFNKKLKNKLKSLWGCRRFEEGSSFPTCVNDTAIRVLFWDACNDYVIAI